METIEAFLSSNGIQESDLILDGTFKELKTKSGFKGWYVGDQIGDGKRTITIEDWRTRDRKTFIEGVDLTDPNEREKLEAVRLRYEKEKRDLQLLKKDFSQRRLEKFASQEWKTPSQYLTKKKIEHSYGALLVKSDVEVTDLIIPMQDIRGEIWNYQTIQDCGAKAFVPGALVDGLFFQLLPTCVSENIIICEGFATSCSVQASGVVANVVCAFSANNLLAVAEIMRELHPRAKILIAGDDDYKKDPNTGREKAEAAAKAVLGGVAFPVFPKVRGANDSDWNDLHQRYDLALVKKQIEAAILNTPVPNEAWSNSFAEAKKQLNTDTKQGAKAHDAHIKRADALTVIAPYANGVQPLPMKISKQGQPILPPEFTVADALFKYYEGRTVISDEVVFVYDKTHWKEVDEFSRGKILVQIQVLYNGLATDGKLENTYNQFLKLLQKPPRSLFEPNAYTVNLKNGTLHIEKVGEKWGYRFAAHNREDYCTSMIPIEYDETRKVRNIAFEDMVKRICGSDEDGLEKQKAIRQMYGACLAPVFPHLFMLHGPGGTGKSSLIIPAMSLVHKDNWSSVEPHEFEGFKMESMVGKLVNIVTDIDMTQPIKDNHLKKIEDRKAIRFDRKFKKALMAPPPAIHIFGGNDIPPTFEKSSGAHERRWTFIGIDGFKATGHYSKSFATDVFNENPQGVLNFALDGLQEVLDCNGHFFVPESGKKKMDSWQTIHDSVALFFREIGEGEVKNLKFLAGGRIKRSMLWPIFKEWYDAAYSTRPKLNKIKFYELVQKVRKLPVQIELKIYSGERYFVGLCDTNEIDQPGNLGSAN